MSHRKSFIKYFHASILIALLNLFFLSQVQAQSNEQEFVEPTILAPPFSESTFIPRWQLFREEEAGSEAEIAAFESLKTIAFELGLTDLPAHSLVLLQESLLAEEEENHVRAAQLLTWSVELSPHSPSREFSLTKRALQNSIFNVTEYSGHLRKGYRELWETLAGRAALEALWRASLLRFIAIFSAMLAFVLFIRHSGQAVFDLRLLSGRTLSLIQARWLLGVLALTPALIFFSPILAIFVFLAIISPYFSWLERGIVFVLLFLLIFAPPLARNASRAQAIESSMGQMITSALTSPCDHRCQERLRNVIEQENNQNASLALAWVLFRQEGIRNAEEIRSLTPIDSEELGVSSSAQTLLGNVCFVENNFNLAIEHYEQALVHAQTPQQHGAATLNLYRAYDQVGNAEQAQSNLLLATQSHLPIVDRFRIYNGQTQNRVLMFSPLPTDSAYTAELNSVDPEVAQTMLHARLAPFFGEFHPLLFLRSIYFLIFLVFIGIFPYHFRISSDRCSSCATPTSKKIFEKAHAMRLCVMCYQLRTISGQLTYHQRVARETRVERWRARSSAFKVFSNVIAPGLGFMLSGWTLIGMSFGFFFAVGITLLLTQTRILAIPYALSNTQVVYGIHRIGGAIFFITWLVSSIAGYLASKEDI